MSAGHTYQWRKTGLKRVKLTVAYDGTNYSGWQVQPNGITIESELNRHLSELLGEEIRVIGASRTDAGVHALGNVAVFDTQNRMPAEKISLALNTRLPEDIRIQESREVAADFHPRFCNTIKTYEYRICNRRFPNPCSRLYSLFYYWELDEKKMQEGADYLVGTHDFTSFCTNKPEYKDRVRTIYSLDVQRDGDMITVRIRGNGFLYNMVRIIVGTLLQVGSGKIPPQEIGAILEARDRGHAGDTARPQGLTLVKIEYPDEQDQVVS
jgi:tRNA pseudouridine38-40 synthase